MIQSPCYGCEDRYIGCHDRCHLYTEYREEIDDLNKRIRQVKLEDDIMWGWSERYQYIQNKLRKQ